MWRDDRACRQEVDLAAGVCFIVECPSTHIDRRQGRIVQLHPLVIAVHLAVSVPVNRPRLG